MAMLLYLIFAAVAYGLVSYILSTFKANVPIKTVLITGCDTGFGRMLAKYLYERGWHVFANCLTEKNADELKKELSQLKIDSAKLTTLVFSVTDEKAVKSQLQKVASECPMGLWGVINNAGITQGYLVEFNTLDDYRRVMDVNFMGMVCVTKYALPLIRQAKGRIVNMTSLAGRIASLGMTSYAASKHAGEAFSDGLRQEVKPFGVKVSIIEPGFMKTQIVSNGITEAKRIFESDPQLAKVYNNAWGYQIRSSMPPCGDPQLVIDAYYHALTAAFPKVRYKVGIPSKIFAVLVQVIPAEIMDFLISREVRKLDRK